MDGNSVLIVVAPSTRVDINNSPVEFLGGQTYEMRGMWDSQGNRQS